VGNEQLGRAEADRDCAPPEREQADPGIAHAEAVGEEPLAGAEVDSVQKRERVDRGTAPAEEVCNEPLGKAE
jgi:hypothetical protein